MTHICVSKLTIIGSDNGLSPGRRQAIIWTNAGILLIRTLGTNFSEILGEIHSFSFSKMHLKLSSAKWHFGLGLNELILKCLSFNDFHQFSMTFQGKMPFFFPGQHQIQRLFKARSKFHDFSRLVCTMPIVNPTFRNQLQWNLHQKTKNFVKKMHLKMFLQNVSCFVFYSSRQQTHQHIFTPSGRFTNMICFLTQFTNISIHGNFISPRFNTLIAMAFCTWRNSCAVMACAKFCSVTTARNGVREEQIFHWI